mgnify:CR=1 FL=1
MDVTIAEIFSMYFSLILNKFKIIKKKYWIIADIFLNLLFNFLHDIREILIELFVKKKMIVTKKLLLISFLLWKDFNTWFINVCPIE